MVAFALIAGIWLLFCLTVVPIMTFTHHNRLRAAELRLISQETKIMSLASRSDRRQNEGSEHHLEPSPTSTPLMAPAPVPSATFEEPAEPTASTVPESSSEPVSAAQPMIVEVEEDAAAEPTEDGRSAEQASADADGPGERDLPTLLRSWNPDALLQGRWITILGGIALAIGGLLLVRYGVTAGWFSPELRLISAGLGGAAMVVGGEWIRTRRPHWSLNVASPFAPHAGLVSGGIVTMLAALFAAHSVYGYLPSLITYGAMAGTTLIAAVMALRHGPMVALIAVAGGYVIPILVTSEAPEIWGLTAHLLSVLSVSLLLARQVRWMPIILLGLAGIVVWSVLLLSTGSMVERQAASVLMIVMLAAGLAGLPVDRTDRLDWVSKHGVRPVLLPVSTHAILTLILAAESGGMSMLVAAHLVACAAAALWVDRKVPVTTTVLGAVVLLAFAQDPSLQWSAIAVLPAAAGFVGLYRQRGAPTFLIPILVPVLGVLALLAPHVEGWDGALAGLAAAALFALGAGALESSNRQDAFGRSVAALVLGCLGSLGAGAHFLLEDQWLTLALTLPLPVLVRLSSRLDRLVMSIGVTLVLGMLVFRLTLVPVFDGYPMVTDPLGGWVVTSFLGPIVLTALSWWIVPGRKLSGMGASLLCVLMVLVTAFITLELRLLVAGSLNAPTYGLAEQGTNTALWLAAGFSLMVLADRSDTPRWITLGAGLYVGGAVLHLVLVTVLGGLPVFTQEPVGAWPVLNLLLLAFALPIPLLLLIVRRGRGLGGYWTSAWVRQGLPLLSVILLLLWTGLEVKRGFQGPVMEFRAADGELMAHTITTLLWAVVFLVVGRLRDQLMLRAISVLLLLGVTAKVFLVDMAHLEGLAQAVSFLGLGLALIGIALTAQRMMRSPFKSPEDP